MPAGTGSYALPLRLELFNRTLDGLNTLVFEENTGRLTRSAERLHDIKRATAPEGDQGRSAGLSLRQDDTEVLAPGKHHGPRLSQRAHILAPWQIAGEGHIGAGERPQLLAAISIPNQDETARRHFAKGLDDEIRAFVRGLKRRDDVIIVRMGLKLQIRGA